MKLRNQRFRWHLHFLFEFVKVPWLNAVDIQSVVGETFRCIWRHADVNTYKKLPKDEFIFVEEEISELHFMPFRPTRHYIYPWTLSTCLVVICLKYRCCCPLPPPQQNHVLICFLRFFLLRKLRSLKFFSSWPHSFHLLCFGHRRTENLLCELKNHSGTGGRKRFKNVFTEKLEICSSLIVVHCGMIVA